MKFIEYAQDQSYLFPPSLKELIKEDDLCLVINDIVEKIGVKEIEDKYVEEGNPAYHPKMLIKVYFYAYARGIRSSRKIAQALEDNIRFWYLSGRQTPDFRTISDFRKNHIEEIKGLFQKVVRLCLEMGMASLGLVAVDGTKIKANASDKQTKSKADLKKTLERVEADITSFLEEAEKIDSEEDKGYGQNRRGDEVPEELAKAGSRKEKIEKALEKLTVQNFKSINLTDEDAKIMKVKQQHYDPAYNCQTVVDSQAKVVLAAQTFDTAADVNLLPEIMDAALKTILKKPDKLVADCGYYSAKNMEYLEKLNVDAYIPDTTITKLKKLADEKENKKRFDKENFRYVPWQDCYLCPENQKLPFNKRVPVKRSDVMNRKYKAFGPTCRGCKHFGICTTSRDGRTLEIDGKELVRKKMAEKVRTKEGLAIYSQRMHIAETPFGHIKQNMGFREFLLRGLCKTDGEFKLICTVHNIKMIYKFIKITGPPLHQQLQISPPVTKILATVNC